MESGKMPMDMTDSLLELRYRTVGSWMVNAYALVCPRTAESVLIDPGSEAGMLEEMLTGTNPVAILVTHSHPDHIGALATMRTRLSVPVMAHAGSEGEPSPVKADQWLRDGDTLVVGDHRIHIIHTPGHTADQVCIKLIDDHRILVGDTIFAGGPGRTLSGRDFQATLKTLERIILSWSDNTVCYPGHGDAFQLGLCRKAIETFLKKDHGGFFGDAEWGQ
jgi:hydroxyacylglutathione hydrolase